MYFRPRSNWKEECKHEIFKKQTQKKRPLLLKSSLPWRIFQHQEVNEWSFYYHFVSPVKYFSPLSWLIVPGLVTYQQSGLLQPHPWPLIGQFWPILGSDWLKFPLLLPICEMTGLGLMINLTTIITVTHNKFASGQTENRKKGRNRKRIINSWRVLLLS